MIEAITENLALKLEMWKELDQDRQGGGGVRDEYVLAGGDRPGGRDGRPEQFVGLHYFNPAQVMKLVEVVRCVTTSDEAFETALRVRAIGGQAGDRNERPGGVHRQPAAGAVHARRDAGLRRGRGLGGGDRRGDEGRRGTPDGAAGAVGLRRVGHARLDMRRAARGVSRAKVRAAADAAQDAERGLVRAQVGDGVLRSTAGDASPVENPGISRAGQA